MARPGRIRGSETVEKVRQLSARRVRAASLHRGADALDHADQDQEGDRREGQGLGEPDPGQAIDPARGGDVEGPVHELGDRARAAEQQDQGQADHEGRRDDRQHRQDPQGPLQAKAGARGDQGEGQAEQGRAQAGQHRQQQRVPGDPALHGLAQAAQAPDLAVEELAEEDGGGVGAVLVLQRAGHDVEDREEDEGPDQGDDQADGTDHEDVALDQAARRQALGEEEEQRAADQQRAVAHAELAGAQRTEGGLEQAELPAADADGEGLQEEVGQTAAARG